MKYIYLIYTTVQFNCLNYNSSLSSYSLDADSIREPLGFHSQRFIWYFDVNIIGRHWLFQLISCRKPSWNNTEWNDTNGSLCVISVISFSVSDWNDKTPNNRIPKQRSHTIIQVGFFFPVTKSLKISSSSTAQTHFANSCVKTQQ